MLFWSIAARKGLFGLCIVAHRYNAITRRHGFSAMFGVYFSNNSKVAMTAKNDVPFPLTDYLRRIEAAEVYDVAIESPLDYAPNLSARLGNAVFFKREDQQPVFSFKLRGAYNKMAKLSAEALKRGVVAASAGNHAQGVALSAQKLGCRAVIVMPTTTPGIKVNAVRSRGGEVVLFGDSFDDAYNEARRL